MACVNNLCIIGDSCNHSSIMPRLILYVIILSFISGGLYAVYSYGMIQERAEWRWNELKAVEAARIDEKRKQKLINEVIQRQYDEISNINAALNDDLIKLRDRPKRNEMPREAGIACKGVTGAELSSPDAIFLARLATRADRIRAALKACYDAL